MTFTVFCKAKLQTSPFFFFDLRLGPSSKKKLIAMGFTFKESAFFFKSFRLCSMSSMVEKYFFWYCTKTYGDKKLVDKKLYRLRGVLGYSFGYNDEGHVTTRAARVFGVFCKKYYD